jgi:hypothetical protein
MERSPQMEPSTAARARLSDPAGEQAWLTATLRPAGALDQAALGRLGAALDALAAASNMVIVDLAAADVRHPRALARALRGPAAAFERAGRCLLVMGATPALAAELDRAAVAVVTLAADTPPDPRAALPDLPAALPGLPAALPGPRAAV